MALRYFKNKRKERAMSVITVIATMGVALGVAALIVALSIMNGFERDLRTALIGANAHITINNLTSKPATKSFNKEVLADILATENVQRYEPFLLHQALIVGPKTSAGALVKGISIELALKNEDLLNAFSASSSETTSATMGADILQKLSGPALHEELGVGTSRNFDKSPQLLDSIILGSILARKLGVRVDDTVLLIPPEMRVSPFGSLPRSKKLWVRGIYQSGLSGYDETLSFIRLGLAQKLFKKTTKYSGLAIYVDDPYLVEQTSEKLALKFPFPYLIRTWIDDNHNIFSVLTIEKYSLAIILALIILIASFNIIGSLIMLVQEKRRDIAILKALGATNRVILKIFMLQGVIIGIVGTAIGFILGLVICLALQNFQIIDIPAGVYVNNRIPMQIQWGQVMLILGLSLLICFLVTLVPARRAASTNPVSVLRYE